jgi:predicted nucleic acid-binding protein
MKILIDTNIILDVLLNRAPWVTDSQAIWDA